MDQYGDQQAAYTSGRAAFGPYGGAMYTGHMGYGGAGYAGGYADPTGMGAAGLGAAGAMAMPVGYAPPAYVQPPFGGMYMQRAGMRRSFGQAIGWIDPARNVSAYEYQMTAAQSFGEKLGAGTAGAAIGGAGIAAGMAAAPIGGAIGGLIGAGIGTFIAGPLGTVAGGAIGSAVGTLAGAIAGSTVAGAVVDVMGQQRDIRNYLETSSFRFVGAGSAMADPRMGRGMSTRARGEMAEFMTKMDVSDRFVDMGDLTRILRAGAEQGVFTGTQNMDDFKKRFKTLTDNVKEIAKAFNTSLEDAVKVVRDMRSMGMDAGQARQAVTQAESFGKVAGRTAAEMFAVGQQGAEMYRGTGVSMQIGFQAAQANLAAIRSARDAGVLSQEAIAQAGGEEALAQRQVAGALGFQQTAFGRGMMMSMVQGGRLDLGQMNRYLTGQAGTLSDIAQRAAQNISSPADLIRFQARQPQLLSEFGKKMGGEASQLSEMSALVSSADYLRNAVPGLSGDDAFRFSAQRLGKTEPEIEAMLARMKNREKEFQSRQTAAQTTKFKQAADEAQANFVLTRAWEGVKDVGTSIASTITNPINRAIDSFSEGWKGFVERQIYGMQRADLSNVSYQQTMATDLVEKQQDLVKLVSAPPRRSAYSVDEMVGEVREQVEKTAVILGGGTTSPIEKKADARSKKIFDALGVSLETDPAKIYLGLGKQEGRQVGLSRESLEKLSQTNRMFSISGREAQAIRETDSYKKRAAEIGDKIQTLVLKPEGGGPRDFPAFVKEVTGKDLKDLTQEEMTAVKTEAATTKYRTLVNDFESTMRAADNLAKGVDEIRSKESAISPVRKRTLNLDQTGYFASSGGEKISALLGYEKGSSNLLTSMFGVTATTDKAQMAVVLDEQFGGLRKVGIGQSDVQKLEQFARVSRVTEEEAKNIREGDFYKKNSQRVTDELQNISPSKISTREVAKKVFGKELYDLNREELTLLKDKFANEAGYEKHLDNIEDASRAVQAFSSDVDAAQMEAVETDYKKVKEKAEKKIGLGELSDKAFDLVSMAMQETKDKVKQRQHISAAATIIAKETGEDIKDVREALEGVQKDTALSKELGSQKFNIQALQVVRGVKQKATQLETLAGQLKDPRQISALMAVSEKMTVAGGAQALASLSREEKAALETSGDTATLGLATTLESIRTATKEVDGKQFAESSAVKDILNQSGLNLSEDTKTYYAEQAQKGNVKEVMASLYQTQLASPETQKAVGGGAGAGGQNVGTGTAEQQYMTTVATSQAVLSCLEALARKLEARK